MIGEISLNRLKVIIFTSILIIIPLIVIILAGKTYTLKLDKNRYNYSIDDLSVKIEDDSVIEIIEKKEDNNNLIFKFKSKSTGHSFFEILDQEDTTCYMNSFYIHKFGVITFNEKYGNSSFSFIIPISLSIWIAYITFGLIKKFKVSYSKSIYQYVNIAYLGLIIFLSFSFLSQILSIREYRGFIYTIKGMINLSSHFSILVLPIAFITSILVTLLGFILVKREGMNIKNLLGILLGLFFCVATILPFKLNDILQAATWIDVHNEAGFATYLQRFLEVTIFSVVAYLECILLATIILGIKSVRRIPKFDKDFIIILGCQIKKDGTLTKLLQGRADRAIEFAKMQKENTNKDIKFVPSGGQGDDEVVSEALAIKNYLVEQGIKEKDIIIEDKSKNTFENIKFSNNLIKEKMKKAQIAFSTTNYHVFRAGCIANQQCLQMEGIGAKTKIYFWINAFIREFIATLFSEKKKHIIMISAILFISIIMIAITYFNNNNI